MSKSIPQRMRSRQKRIEGRLDRFNYPLDMSRPMMRLGNLQYELADRAVGTAYGGIGLVHQLVQRLGESESAVLAKVVASES